MKTQEQRSRAESRKPVPFKFTDVWTTVLLQLPQSHVVGDSVIVVCYACHFLFSVMGERDRDKSFLCENCWPVEARR